jgi:DNA polymerase
VSDQAGSPDERRLQGLRDRLRYWTESGVTHLAVPKAAQAVVEQEPVKQASQASQASQTTSVPRTAPVSWTAPVSQTPTAPVKIQPPAAPCEPVIAPAPVTQSGDPLAQLAESLIGCTRCSLAPGRTHIVFGVGDPNADIVFVGEAPGRDEDLKGEPFVGEAGKLLTTIIEKGMGVSRASVYICNTVKCRPSENRNPKPDEMAACEPFLAQQLAIIRPKVIVALGKFAAQAICKSDVPISRLRGNWHKYEDIDVMPTFHPAYLLRSPSAKRDVWADIKQVMAKVGLNKP